MHLLKTRRKPIIYKVIRERLYHKDIGKYVSYGIVAIDQATGKEILRVSDVSTSRRFVLDLARLYTEEELAPTHLFDAVYDKLSE